MNTNLNPQELVMNTKCDPREFVVALLSRSQCSVQVAACLADKYGIFAWGINHSGPTGMGEHAEVMCLRRANPARVPASTLYVAARRRKSGRAVIARPCEACARIASKCPEISYRSQTGTWFTETKDVMWSLGLSKYPSK